MHVRTDAYIHTYTYTHTHTDTHIIYGYSHGSVWAHTKFNFDFQCCSVPRLHWLHQHECCSTSSTSSWCKSTHSYIYIHSNSPFRVRIRIHKCLSIGQQFPSSSHSMSWTCGKVMQDLFLLCRAISRHGISERKTLLATIENLEAILAEKVKTWDTTEGNVTHVPPLRSTRPSMDGSSLFNYWS
jgi:hypothetical protein